MSSQPDTPDAPGVTAVPFPSPCVRLCTLNDDDVCVGCGRTLDDIRRWSSMGNPERVACVERARARLPGLRPDWTQPPPAVVKR